MTNSNSKSKSFAEHDEIFKERTGNNFNFYYKKYYTKLIYFTSKMCGDYQKAEDFTTESFLTAFDKIDKYEKDKSQFSTWLFTIARNIVLQDIKNKKKTISIDVEINEEGATLKDFISDEEDTYRDLDVSERKSEIMMGYISKLKEPYRKVIEMREIQKMSYKDIASELNSNLSTIKSRIRNGRILLMDMTKTQFSKIDEIYA